MTGIIWLRLGRPQELTVVWKANSLPETRFRRYTAWRMPGAPDTVTRLNFLVVHAMHTVADGQSYEPIVGDLLALYSSLRPGACEALQPLAVNGLDELQRRLHGVLNGADPDAFPQQCSLRGGTWRSQQWGYGHDLVLRRGALRALEHASRHYGAPLDALLLAISVSAIARAGGKNEVQLSLYVPMRDGPAEAGLVGLFSDWRDIVICTETATATVIGVVLEVAHVLRTRRWAVFNAINKPDVTMVNFQAMDTAPPGSRAGFVQIGEELWRIGDRLGRSDTRKEELERVQQPLAFSISQQDAEQWNIHLHCSYDRYPPSWMRRFVKSFEDAFWAVLKEPTQRVHRAFPANFY
eukprot:gnl/TRDRNA2_/TRDRNA2_153035_c0_seq1.p1 gnl/TRDRNA2_/TRDRNA2_153035_c0~~gnl/TRDRNA2_/TRDRNA2_153035_c0_seq1.p1  ORF type:complete len:381 (-),score=57.60 gnl/TRDRNA2_/TRDRNA2_153035_c0_seq1:27-1082(-)